MKPRTVGLALALTCSLGWNAYAIHEVLKLDDKVDELTAEIEAKDVAMKEKRKELKVLQSEVSSRDKEVDTLTTKSNELAEKVDTLTKAILAKDKALKAKDTEIQSLKKTKPVSTVSRGQDYREVSVLGTNFQVTWYNDYNYTKSGRFVTDNVTVAVDPRVIPLDTWIKIEMPDGREFIRRADDTGGKVKGNIIDIYDNVSTKELYRRGRTHGVKVTILKKM